MRGKNKIEFFKPLPFSQGKYCSILNKVKKLFIMNFVDNLMFIFCFLKLLSWQYLGTYKCFLSCCTMPEQLFVGPLSYCAFPGVNNPWYPVELLSPLQKDFHSQDMFGINPNHVVLVSTLQWYSTTWVKARGNNEFQEKDIEFHHWPKFFFFFDLFWGSFSSYKVVKGG